VFNVDSLPGVFIVPFQRSGLAWWAQFQFCLFQGLSQLGDLPVAVHFYLERFFFLCELSLVLYLLAAAAFYEQFCRASVLVIACLVFMNMSSSYFFSV